MHMRLRAAYNGRLQVGPYEGVVVRTYRAASISGSVINCFNATSGRVLCDNDFKANFLTYNAETQLVQET